MSCSGTFEIHRFGEVTSTNSIVKDKIREGAPHGYCAMAQAQTSGYGRRKSHWISKPGNLYLSVLLKPQRPKAEWATLSLVCALAVRRALVSLLPDAVHSQVQVKWPNDVVFAEAGGASYQKLCGISLEAIGDAVCLGIGVNIVCGTQEICASGEGAYDAGSLEELGATELDVDRVGDLVLGELERCFQEWEKGSFSEFASEFQKASFLKDRHVRIEPDSPDGSPLEGIVRGLDSQGAVIIETASGAEHLYGMGKVELL